MSDFGNEICLFGLCIAILAMPSGDPLSIAGFLSAIVVMCGRALKGPLRLSVQLAYLICACFFHAFLIFLPVVVYGLMHHRTWLFRLLWLGPLVLWVFGGLTALESIQMVVLCAVACVLAAADRRIASERKGLTYAYDNLRERLVAMANLKSVSDADTPKPEPITTLFEDLSPRESAVAQLVAEGLDNREISQRLFLSEGTVRNYISSILAKKGLENRTQIAVMYYTG